MSFTMGQYVAINYFGFSWPAKIGNFNDFPDIEDNKKRYKKPVFIEYMGKDFEHTETEWMEEDSEAIVPIEGVDFKKEIEFLESGNKSKEFRNSYLEKAIKSYYNVLESRKNTDHPGYMNLKLFVGAKKRKRLEKKHKGRDKKRRKTNSSHNARHRTPRSKKGKQGQSKKGPEIPPPPIPELSSPKQNMSTILEEPATPPPPANGDTSSPLRLPQPEEEEIDEDVLDDEPETPETPKKTAEESTPVVVPPPAVVVPPPPQPSNDDTPLVGFYHDTNRVPVERSFANQPFEMDLFSPEEDEDPSHFWSVEQCINFQKEMNAICFEEKPDFEKLNELIEGFENANISTRIYATMNFTTFFDRIIFQFRRNVNVNINVYKDVNRAYNKKKARFHAAKTRNLKKMINSKEEIPSGSKEFDDRIEDQFKNLGAFTGDGMRDFARKLIANELLKKNEMFRKKNVLVEECIYRANEIESKIYDRFTFDKDANDPNMQYFSRIGNMKYCAQFIGREMLNGTKYTMDEIVSNGFTQRIRDEFWKK